MDQSKINRRGFLGTMGAAATGLALATNATAQTRGRMLRRQPLDQARTY
ncbi:secreted protein [Phyllobacterium bourgognense]|uniref:Secreted protein n=1 Tax=Phyllobacterium bourgognense TaxID=314236 RepID=A0A368YLV0_9HYPH|nr:secreted protein [Phyllobacterium bourgognense]